MKRLIALTLMLGILATGMPARAAGESDTIYANGTLAGLKNGTAGTLDVTPSERLEFHGAGAQFSIGYASLTGAKYCRENRFRLGVLGTIAVGLLKARSKRHLMTVTWKDEHAVAQVATFELSRENAAGLWTAFEVRAPQLNLKAMVSTCDTGWPN